MTPTGDAPAEQRAARGRTAIHALWLALGLPGAAVLSLAPGPLPAMILFTGFTAIILACVAGIARSIWRAGRR